MAPYYSYRPTGRRGAVQHVIVHITVPESNQHRGHAHHPAQRRPWNRRQGHVTRNPRPRQHWVQRGRGNRGYRQPQQPRGNGPQQRRAPHPDGNSRQRRTARRALERQVANAQAQVWDLPSMLNNQPSTSSGSTGTYGYSTSGESHYFSDEYLAERRSAIDFVDLEDYITSEPALPDWPEFAPSPLDEQILQEQEELFSENDGKIRQEQVSSAGENSEATDTDCPAPQPSYSPAPSIAEPSTSSDDSRRAFAEELDRVIDIHQQSGDWRIEDTCQSDDESP